MENAADFRKRSRRDRTVAGPSSGHCQEGRPSGLRRSPHGVPRHLEVSENLFSWAHVSGFEKTFWRPQEKQVTLTPTKHLELQRRECTHRDINLEEGLLVATRPLLQDRKVHGRALLFGSCHPQGRGRELNIASSCAVCSFAQAAATDGKCGDAGACFARRPRLRTGREAFRFSVVSSHCSWSCQRELPPPRRGLGQNRSLLHARATSPLEVVTRFEYPPTPAQTWATPLNFKLVMNRELV